METPGLSELGSFFYKIGDAYPIPNVCSLEVRMVT